MEKNREYKSVMNFGVVDFVILIIIISSAIYGAFKGFISQIVSIVSLLLGVWCAFKFSGFIAAEIKEIFSIGESTVYIISFIIILILIMILGKFLGKVLEGIIKFSMLGWLNRLLGVLFSTIKTVVILSLIVFVLDYINQMWHLFPKDDAFAGSVFYPELTKWSKKIFPYLQSLLS